LICSLQNLLLKVKGLAARNVKAALTVSTAPFVAPKAFTPESTAVITIGIVERAVCITI